VSHSKFIKVFLGLSLIGTAFCSQPAPTSQAPKTGVEPYTVRIRFDGGYAMIRDKKAKTLTVASFGIDTNDNDHGMKMSVQTGTIDGSPSDALKPNDDNLLIWNLAYIDKSEPYEVSVDAKSSVKTPNRSTKYDCEAIADQKADGYSLVPNIQDLATKAGAVNTSVKGDLLRNRVTLNGEDYRIDRAASCWDVRIGGTTHHVQRLPGGIGGVEVYFNNLTSDSFEIKVKHGTVMNRVYVKPVEIAGRREIAIWFGRFPHCSKPPCTTEPGSPNGDFKRFFDLLNTSMTDSSWYPQLYKIASGDLSQTKVQPAAARLIIAPPTVEIRSPGDECPQGDYDGPLSAAAPATKSGGH